jgi:hypothetical protein
LVSGATVKGTITGSGRGEKGEDQQEFS